MLEKTVRMNALFDFYQPLLTGKQQQYMEMYYLNDFSLGEIAEQFDVSRQAVYDNVKRTEYMLEEYEEKLGLYHKYVKRTELYRRLRSHAEDNDSPSPGLIKIVESLEILEEEGTNDGV
ncbi:putative DNA-binding protein [Alteribacillus iranensis]|uniref:UPF0122 protein SAMN05192532_101693 n=1 Tax=Alteribacillus iranensis TaxID=930128 RepID=A0A1I2A6P2_9BACI|nr:putative DNA-binding protein [Alteribacillus iranensis]SFE39612.1 hypothetical protein SAMN05192532_101693 [Alteribacillus iranensis]